MSAEVESVPNIKPHLLQAMPQVNSTIKNDYSKDDHLKLVASDKTDLKKNNDGNKSATKSPLKEQDLQRLSKELNREMKRIHSKLVFQYNEQIGSLVVIIKDSNGDKIIREIPSQEVVRLMEKMRDIVGIIFDKKG